MVLRLIILPIYGRYLWLKNKFSQKTKLTREKFVLAFTNRFVIHLIILAMGIGVVTANVLAYESREDYGKNALIYNIVGLEDYEFTEDASNNNEEPKVYSYLEKSSQLQSEMIVDNSEEAVPGEELLDEASLTQGGITLVKPELASTEEAKIGTKGIRDYEVQEGDTVSTIASKFNISVNTILWANSLTLNTLIRPGRKLTVPPTSGVLHTIKKGDTLAKIAKSYEAEMEQIKSFNNFSDDSSLVVGERIMVPGGRIIYTPTPRAYTEVARTTTKTSEGISIPVSGRMAWPSGCYRISQYYKGWRHTGVDIACPWGTAIKAALAGKVVRVQYGRTGYGYNVIIDHGGGKQTLYGHLSRIDVEVGQWVSTGEVIAAEGSTGRSTGPHLHFEVRVGGSRVNPLSYIR